MSTKKSRRKLSLSRETLTQALGAEIHRTTHRCHESIHFTCQFSDIWTDCLQLCG